MHSAKDTSAVREAQGPNCVFRTGSPQLSDNHDYLTMFEMLVTVIIQPLLMLKSFTK